MEREGRWRDREEREEESEGERRKIIAYKGDGQYRRIRIFDTERSKV